MTKGCHRNDISTLTVHIITQVPQFGTRRNKVIQKNIIGTSVNVSLKSHSLTNTRNVRGIGVRNVGNCNYIMLDRHSYRREPYSVSCWYHIDAVPLNLMVIDDVGIWKLPCYHCNLLVFHQFVNKTQGCLKIAMLCSLEIRMMTSDSRGCMIHDRRELTTPRRTFWHGVLLL